MEADLIDVGFVDDMKKGGRGGGGGGFIAPLTGPDRVLPMPMPMPAPSVPPFSYPPPKGPVSLCPCRRIREPSGIGLVVGWAGAGMGWG